MTNPTSKECSHLKLLRGTDTLWRCMECRKAFTLSGDSSAPETKALPPLCDGAVQVIYHRGEPTGVRDAAGYLCFFNRVTKWPGQEERYRKELALRARHAEVIANALRSAQETEPKFVAPEPHDAGCRVARGGSCNCRLAAEKTEKVYCSQCGQEDRDCYCDPSSPSQKASCDCSDSDAAECNGGTKERDCTCDCHEARSEGCPHKAVGLCMACEAVRQAGSV